VIALLAGALLVGSILRAINRLEHIRSQDVVGADANLPPGVAEPRYGFWLALIGLVGLAIGHGVALLRERRRVPAPVRPAAPEGHGLEGLF
jgi:hypothetical protein